MKIPNKDNLMALFHINACSLDKHFDDLEHLCSCTNKNFDVITGTRITKNVSLTNNLTMNKFSFEFTTTESSSVGTLLANHLLYKPELD